MFKKQLIIEVEGVDDATVAQAFSIIRREFADDFVDQAHQAVEAEGVEFDDDLSIQSFTKTFHD